ncbi:MAG: hypothetical protein B6D45_09790, partial [Ignavibacteriales bacterium UTCHB3]
EEICGRGGFLPGGDDLKKLGSDFRGGDGLKKLGLVFWGGYGLFLGIGVRRLDFLGRGESVQHLTILSATCNQSFHF